MKRSEMVRAMAQEWIGLFPDEQTEEYLFEEEFIEELEGKMDKLLSFLEHKGMKPPVLQIDPVLYNVTHVWSNEDDKT